jgi:RNA polymerase sigma-70 factor (ECF subfamily)
LVETVGIGEAMARPLGNDMPVTRQREPATENDEADADLVAAARRDPRAFAPLYQRYVDPVYRYCFRHLGAREEAEDATSQIFTQALAGLPRLGAQPFRAWLFAIAHNVVVDVHRTRRPTGPLILADVHEDPGPTPEQTALAAEDGRTIRTLLAQLPPEARELMELRLAGLTDVEIARALGRSHGAIRVAQHRTVVRLRALRDTLGAKGGHGG